MEKASTNIPEAYVGKRVEYIIFSIENEDLSNHEQTTHKTISSLKGALHRYADVSKLGLEESE